MNKYIIFFFVLLGGLFSNNINSFEIKSSLPINTIIYPSNKYNGKLIGPKSGYINIKS